MTCAKGWMMVTLDSDDKKEELENETVDEEIKCKNNYRGLSKNRAFTPNSTHPRNYLLRSIPFALIILFEGLPDGIPGESGH